ncbi:hypothetical protein Enr10x_53710 [Gimesia panareensis]|uniref:Uncharacterized protein n=1 Tax=Gimesia panareensis TaxID=2527978 RepID=A0A517QEE5_9PLAN|nr:hypothetical protein Enr10x_53710 [Gimesia panareensis]QDU53094.1 hypothetical protein Pan110_54780 [Gimesia panareensis]
MILRRVNSCFTLTFFSSTLKSNRCPVKTTVSSDSNPSLELGGSLDSRTVPRNWGDVKDNLKPELVWRLVEKDLYEISMTTTGVLGVRYYWGSQRDAIILYGHYPRVIRTFKDSLMSLCVFLKVQTEATTSPGASTPQLQLRMQLLIFQRNAGEMATQDVKPSLFLTR